MEEQDSISEPFRKTLHGELQDNKWKKIAYIFFVILVLAVAGAAIIIFLYFSKDIEDENDNDNSIWKWEPKGDRIKTSWGKKLDPNKVWQEYPRPQLERKDWINLNGLWKYHISKQDDAYPLKFDGNILVPFPIESSLSGVMKTFNKDDLLWYDREFEIPKEWEGKNILINFGAVDWKCELFINRKRVGEHTGGYSSFYFDITEYAVIGKNNITVKVIDITDTSNSWGKYQPVGKQTITPNGIWYTPASGIWQTVWLEPVNKNYIEKLEINNDFDNKKIKINFKVGNDLKLNVEYSVEFNNKVVGNAKGVSNEDISIKLTDENFKPWSPSEPNLYIIKARLLNSSEELDSITSYTTIRKIESKPDSNGILRIFLNNKPLFNMGPLDQGYWPDGIYTPPSEEAMLYDINQLKSLGFNTIRKHVKTEFFRYYYHCDKIGMVVWQDMPSGNVGSGGGSWDSSHMDGGTDTQRTQESKDNYYKEWGEIIENLKFFQCIIIWTPFNEAWGQFETEAVVQFTRGKDNSRLVNAASGGNHRIISDFLDLHTYPGPSYILKNTSLINVIGEYGGLGLEIKNHTWKDDNWGYQVLNDKIELTNRYIEFINDLINLVPQGISAAIYTQTTDVEGEINGLMTYDRYDLKVYDIIKEYNKKLIESLVE